MIKEPSRTKYRKAFKGDVSEHTKAGAQLEFGQYGLKALSSGRVTTAQLEAARRAINKFLNRTGKVWIRVFPDIPVTSRPVGVRMGKGKGAVEFWIFRVSPGRVLFEIGGGVDRQIAEGALARAAAKLPVKTKFVYVIEGN